MIPVMADRIIMRHAKLKGSSVHASLQHNFRERPTANADPERTPSNVHEGGTCADDVVAKMHDRLPEKYRKDAVQVIEYMITASPRWFRDSEYHGHTADDLFDRAKAWLVEKYGQENILLTTIHNDETTPHLVAYITPVKADGKLSAAHWIGNRKKLSDAQDEIFERVKDIGLERGTKGSTAEHTTIKQFYDAIGPVDTPKLKLEDIKPKKTGTLKREKPTEVLNRLNSYIAEQWTLGGLKTAQIHLQSDKIRTLEMDAQKNRMFADKGRKWFHAMNHLNADQKKYFNDVEADLFAMAEHNKVHKNSSATHYKPRPKPPKVAESKLKTEVINERQNSGNRTRTAITARATYNDIKSLEFRQAQRTSRYNRGQSPGLHRTQNQGQRI